MFIFTQWNLKNDAIPNMLSVVWYRLVSYQWDEVVDTRLYVALEEAALGIYLFIYYDSNSIKFLLTT